jgi:hypothetical protein
MNLEPAPRPSRAAFFVTAAACFTAVVLIGLFAPDKFAALPMLSAVGFLILSITALMIPVLLNYAADSAEYVQREREKVNEQVQRLHAASESLSRSAAQIKAVEEAVHKTAHAAETLPYRMQEKLAEFNETLAEKEAGDREALEEELTELRASNSDQLKAVAEKIHKAAADWTALETATRKQLSAAEAVLTKVQTAGIDTAAKFEAKLTAALAALDGKLAGLPATTLASSQPSSPTIESASPAPEPKSNPPVESTSVVESIAVVETEPSSPAIVEEPKPKKNRPPRKPRAEELLAAMSESSPTTEHEAAVPAKTSVEAPSEAYSAATAVESSSSSDGATRLLATAYIGIGNKLFIRGEGPGLSWEKGAPMQFVSIGKWGWASHDAAAPVRCKLYKNDETAALTGEVVLEPGKHVEVTALF